MKSGSQRWSFRFMITFVFVPLVIIVVLFNCAFSYWIVRVSEKDTVVKNAQNILLMVGKYLDSMLENAVSILLDIQGSDEVSGILRSVETEGSISSAPYLAMQHYLDEVFSKHYEILDSVAVSFENVETPFYRSFYQLEEYFIDWKNGSWMNRFLHQPMRWRHPETKSEFQLRRNHEHTIGLSKLVTARSGYRYYINLEIKESVLLSVFNNVFRYDGSSLFIISEDNQAFYSNVGFEDVNVMDDQILTWLHQPNRSDSLQTEKYLIVYESLKINGWKVGVCIPLSEVFEGVNKLWSIHLIMLGLVFLFSTAMIVIISLAVSNPLKRMAVQLAQISAEQLPEYNVKIPSYASDEVHILNSSLTMLFSRLEELIKNVERKQREKRDMEYQLLLAQINPHFLYNTLYGIEMECLIGKTGEAVAMLEELASFYRLGLSSGKGRVAFATELAHTQKYLQLYMRSSSIDFSCEIDCPESVNNLELPKLTLQPIVENCIIHGFGKKRKEERYVLKISAVRPVDGNEWRIVVDDNGIGMMPHELQRVREQLTTPYAPVSSFGLYNINRRIQIHYGQEYGIDLISRENQGVSVIIRLPVIVYKTNDKKE